jgi:Ca2+-binding EF-hand superfamily protein
MKLTARIVPALVTSLLLGAGVAAAHPGAGPGDDASRAEHKARKMERFDTNKDGVLDDAEKAAMRQAFEQRHAERKAKFLERFDTNKDGQLDASEKAAADKARAEHRAQRVDRIMGELDKNRDNRLTSDELPQGKGQHLRRADANNDGAISREELSNAKMRRGFHGGHRGPKGPQGQQR